jgi:transcriptional regulator with XRE-family HTH domain
MIIHMTKSASNQVLNTGKSIQSLREQRKITLRALARESDISPGYLSQIENGKVDPSLSVLTRLALALKVPLYSLLLNEETAAHTLVRYNERNKVIFGNEGIETEIIHMDYAKRFDLTIISLRPNCASSEAPVIHEGDECILVSIGKLKVEFVNESLDLDVGDSLYFDSTIPHRLVNVGKDICKFIHSHSPPGFPGRRTAIPQRR